MAGRARVGAVLAAAALALGATACGDEGEPAGATGTTAAPATTAPPTTGTSTAPPTTGTTVPDDAAAARAHCTEHGGTVQARTPWWGTNGPEAEWVAFGGEVELCRFQTLHDEADSRIYVELGTLYADEPTLAAVAYRAKVPLPPATGGGNPATAYCAHLGGSSSFGNGAAGGGWVERSDPDDVVVALCVFPDGSAIDEWGLAYHADGVVRGIDLDGVLRWSGDPLPPVFG